MCMKKKLGYSLAIVLAAALASCNDSGNNMSKEDEHIQQDSLDTRRNTTESTNTLPDTATMKVDTTGRDTTQPAPGTPR